MKLALRDIYEGSDWWRVTAGHAVDEVHYRVAADGEEREGYSSLKPFVYIYLRLHGNEPPVEYSLFEVLHEDESSLRVSVGRIRGIKVETTRKELLSEVEDFLAEAFAELDEKTSPEKRDEAFEYLSNEFQTEFRDIYEVIMKH